MALDLSALQKAKSKLNSVVTKVVRPDGSVFEEERRGNDGFVEVNDDEADTAGVSNRRRKTVERARRFGYVVDLKPDLQVAGVCDGVFLSSQDVVNDFQLLKSNGITHIVNAGVGIANVFPKKFVYLNVNLLDLPDSDIRPHFDTVLPFMRDAVEGGGKVLVHCNAGVSRSASFAIAYIIRFHKSKFLDAFNQVRGVRPAVKPNAGFERQLREYEKELAAANDC